MLELKWTDCSYEDELRRIAAYYDSATYQVFIESVDAELRCEEIMPQLESDWGHQMHWRAPCFLELREFLSQDLGLNVFDGYDAVWFVRPEKQRISAPSFYTYIAAEGEGWLPCDKDSTEHVASWEVVDGWMEDNGVVSGVIQGGKLLTVERA